MSEDTRAMGAAIPAAVSEYVFAELPITAAARLRFLETAHEELMAILPRLIAAAGYDPRMPAPRRLHGDAGELLARLSRPTYAKEE